MNIKKDIPVLLVKFFLYIILMDLDIDFLIE